MPENKQRRNEVLAELGHPPEEEDAGAEAQEEQNPPPAATRREGEGHGRRTRIDDRIASEGSQLPLDRCGKVGVKEIERLIQKLEIDKEILADQEDEEAAN
jgi:hypothetical protein